MTQFVSARPLIIVSQEDIAIQILQAVPAEGVFAAFTEHLGTALVSLNVDATHGTLLDGSVRVTVGEASAFISSKG